MDLSFNINSELDPIAIYAALVATAVLFWDVIKWWRSGAKLKGSATANMITFGLGTLDGQTFIIVDVNNVGDRPTTIRGVYLKGYANRWNEFRKKPDKAAVINSAFYDSFPIPHRLEIGANFQAAIVQTSEAEEWSQKYRLFAEVAHSSGQSLILHIKPIQP